MDDKWLTIAQRIQPATNVALDERRDVRRWLDEAGKRVHAHLVEKYGCFPSFTLHVKPDTETPINRRHRPMTATETTSLSEISDQLDLLKLYRQRVCSIDHVLRWYDEQKRGLSSASAEIKITLEFRRQHTGAQWDYMNTIRPDPNSIHTILLLAKDHWLSLIPPLEQWLDARQIEHVESAKAD